MNRIIQFLFNRRNFFLFFAIQIIGFNLIYKNNSYYYVEFVNKMKRIVYWSYDNYNSVRQYANYGKHNESLLIQNSKLKTHISLLEKKSNLSNSNEYKNSYIYMSARVIYNSYRKASNYLILNKGKKDGVVLDMGVISDRGVVGIVIAVSENYSKVISLFNMDFNLNVRLKKNFIYGSLSWQLFTDDTATLKDISIRANVNVGDTIMTDGKSFIFPEGINVGVVNYVLKKKKNQSFYDDIKIKLFEDFKDLGYVYLVRNTDKLELDKLMKDEE